MCEDESTPVTFTTTTTLNHRIEDTGDQEVDHHIEDIGQGRNLGRGINIDRGHMNDALTMVITRTGTASILTQNTQVIKDLKEHVVCQSLDQ
jgi:hypothetical protein